MRNVEARWWTADIAGNKISCELCPRKCLIPEGDCGFCSVRRNVAGRLVSISYGRPVALHVDPIEKKPLRKFLPGTQTFSVGCYGCNLDCAFCQNYNLSRGKYCDDDIIEFSLPERIFAMAKSQGCASIAFTYNEPTTWAEYMLDIAKIAKRGGLATVMVSNGYITRKAAEEIFPFIDAANIDMKGFSEKFYSRLTAASLQPVLDTMKLYHSMGKHLEITNLIIPGENDSLEMIDGFLDWTAKNISRKTPIHFTAYHPDYKYLSVPPTSPELLREIKAHAEKKGFKNVFLGNIF
jgi:pyruvate formate lyase activating enzyme